MNFSKAIYLILSIVCAIFSAAIYAFTIFFKSTYDTDWGDIFVLLNPAKVLLVSAVVFLIFFLVFYFSDREFKTKTIRRAFRFVLVVSVLAALSASMYGYNCEKNMWYTEENAEHYTEIQKYLPYNDLFGSDGSSNVVYQVSKSSADSGTKHIAAMNFFETYSQPLSSGHDVHYEAEYFKSRDFLLNIKFITDRTVPSVFNDFVDVEAEPASGEKDGIKYRLFVDCDSYAVSISGKGHAFYANLLDADDFGITAEEFVQTAIEQYRIMQKSAESDVYTF